MKENSNRLIHDKESCRLVKVQTWGNVNLALERIAEVSF